MWRGLVARRVERVFDDIGARRLDRVLSGLAPEVHHRFAGTGPLGGERTSRDAVAQWFERLFRPYPELTFDVHLNHGAHVLRVEKGRVTHLHAYEDSLDVARSCEMMARAGVAEAAAAPMTGPAAD